MSAVRVGLARQVSDRPYESLERLRALIREAVLQAGVGRESPDAPLRELIPAGGTVLLKPNWVMHKNGSGQGMECMITHERFVLAALEEVLSARPARVVLGDAPISTCRFEAVFRPDARQRAQEAADASGTALQVCDFRRKIAREGSLRRGFEEPVGRDEDYVRFDLGMDSWLEPVTGRRTPFRVTNYDPDELARTHRAGRHVYLVSRELFEADVVISLPKLKTHSKAGITGALKNLVGLNGSKDYLPHHRVGGTALGGDCYPGWHPGKRTTELLLDAANRRLGAATYRRWHRAARWVLRRTSSATLLDLEGGWHGNDTCWRMVLDLNRLALYGTIDGTLLDAPQRRIHSLTDALVCGEGEGPLSPSPRPAGLVTFSSSPPAAELVHALLLGLDPARLSVVSRAFDRSLRWPLVAAGTRVLATHAGQVLAAEELRALGVQARPPRGWAGRVEWRGDSRQAPTSLLGESPSPLEAMHRA